MTPFSAPGATAKPPAATPRAPILARAPRPLMGSYGNLGTPVRVAPRVQAPPPTARMPIARPHMPLAPHAQGAPIPGAPRPMASGFAAAAPTPRMQQAPPRAPGIPPNTRGVGASVPSARPHMPLLQPTQRAAPAVANPAAPSLAKRALPTTTTDPAPVQQAKRQATMIPRPQGAAPGGVPLPTNPAAVARAPVPPKHAQGAPATPSRPPPSQVQVRVFGVRHDPSKGWMARVVDPKRRVAREIGPFGEMHLAALAQDRVAIACAGRGIGGGGRAPLNFEPAFYRVETAFLHRWEGDLCGALEDGTYEKIYAKFLMAGYKAALNVKEEEEEGDSADAHEDELIASCVGDGEFFWEDIEYFFLHRATEIGKDALQDNREKLRTRFVEMHRNMSLCQDWRRRNHMEKLKTMMSQNQQQQQIQMHQQQQQQIQMNREQQQQIQMNQEQQQQQIQMKQGQQQQQPIQWQQPQQIQMMQQQRRQQQFQQQQRMMMIQEHRQQQLMSAQQQQQYQDDDATVQVKPELSSSS